MDSPLSHQQEYHETYLLAIADPSDELDQSADYGPAEIITSDEDLLGMITDMTDLSVVRRRSLDFYGFPRVAVRVWTTSDSIHFPGRTVDIGEFL